MGTHPYEHVPACVPTHADTHMLTNTEVFQKPVIMFQWYPMNFPLMFYRKQVTEAQTLISSDWLHQRAVLLNFLLDFKFQ